MLGHSPEKIAELQDVGVKSLTLIKEVCLLYEREGEALQKESLQKMDMLPQNRENIIERDRSKDKF